MLFSRSGSDGAPSGSGLSEARRGNKSRRAPLAMVGVGRTAFEVRKALRRSCLWPACGPGGVRRAARRWWTSSELSDLGDASSSTMAQGASWVSRGVPPAQPPSPGSKGTSRRSPRAKAHRNAQAHRRTADSGGTAAPLAGVGTHARGRVRRSQRRARREGIRLVLPAGDRRRRLHARTHPFINRHQRHGPARHSGRRAHPCQRSLRVVGRHSKGDRPVRSGLTIFFATSFTTALQRVYLRTWRRPPRTAGVAAYWRGAAWLLVVLVGMALLGSLRGALDGGLGFGLFAIVSLAVTSGLWWFTAWVLLQGEVRARVLVPTRGCSCLLG